MSVQLLQRPIRPTQPSDGKASRHAAPGHYTRPVGRHNRGSMSRSSTSSFAGTPVFPPSSRKQVRHLHQASILSTDGMVTLKALNYHLCTPMRIGYCIVLIPSPLDLVGSLCLLHRSLFRPLFSAPPPHPTPPVIPRRGSPFPDTRLLQHIPMLSCLANELSPGSHHSPASGPIACSR